MAERGWVLVDGEWQHRPWWKVAINLALRALQPCSQRKGVLATIFIDRPGGDGPPMIVDYQSRRVQHPRDDTEKSG